MSFMEFAEFYMFQVYFKKVLYLWVFKIPHKVFWAVFQSKWKYQLDWRECVCYKEWYLVFFITDYFSTYASSYVEWSTDKYWSRKLM